MAVTPRLGITQLEEDQALPEVVVNEADLILEMFATRLIVKSKGDNAPAGGEVDGDAYLVGTAGSGAFLGQNNKLALYINGAWIFRTPKEGMEIEVEDEDTSYTLRGGTWESGAGVAIEVLDEGVSETGSLVSLDFVGAGVTATDDGSGNVEINIPGGTSAKTLITETVTSGSATNVQFAAIAGTYRDLEIRVRGRGTKAATLVDIRLRFNGDTGANYDVESQQANNTTNANFANAAATSAYVGNIAAASATANVADCIVIYVADYRGTTFQKAGNYIATLKTGTAAANLFNEVGSIWWRSTAAITQVDIFPSGNAFVDGTVVSLYGHA
jgi:hypothetical protein